MKRSGRSFGVNSATVTVPLAIIHLWRRRLVWTNVTASPTSEDRPPDHRGLLLGIGAELPHPRYRQLLRRHRQKEDPGDGHPRLTNRAPLALAERTHRTAHRLDPARMPGPFPGPERGPSEPDPHGLWPISIDILTMIQSSSRFSRTFCCSLQAQRSFTSIRALCLLPSRPATNVRLRIGYPH
jgi:hypothetical protein